MNEPDKRLIMNLFFSQKTPIILLAALLLLTTYFLLPTPALAQEPTYDDISEVAKNLNCPTCQGINLSDCRTLTCEQWREQIGELLAQGYSEQEVLDYFAERYGTQVLQEPPRSGFTLLLWILPVIALLAGGGWLYYTMHDWSQKSAPIEAATAAAPPSQSSQSDVSDDYLSQVERDLGLDEV